MQEGRWIEGRDSPDHPVPASSVNLLVVDDQLANRSAFLTLLEPLGYNVFAASGGHEALTLATQHRFAVMLLDVRMPVLDGIQTALLLKKKPFSRNAPIIFVSAHPGTAEDVSRVWLDGIIGYVHAPVDTELLVWKVKNYVGHFLRNEEIRLQAALAWHAAQEHRNSLNLELHLPPEIRKSELNLRTALAELKNLLADRFGVWAGK